jgi:tetratricopeptide (TPR) repeat protein
MNQTENDHPSAESSYLRAELLRQQSRPAEAAAFYQQALAADPNHVMSMAMLAICWMQDESKRQQAVDIAKKAVTLEPDDAFFHGVLALAMANAVKEGQKAPMLQALEEAQAAVRLNPHSDFTHSVEAQIQLRLRNYPEAEAAAKRALNYNTENTAAASVLSVALLQQRKDEDNSHLVRYQLERNPEDSSSHTSAGWLALRTGNHQQANQHFLEALRLDPMNEGARLGLVESYRARSSVYRAYISFVHFMSKFTEGKQQVIMIGGYVVYRLMYESLKTISPILAEVLVAAWLTLALWSHLVRGFSSFFMLFDGYARRSLRTKEIWEGVAVGGMTMAALALFAAGLVWIPDGVVAAGALLASAVVSAAAFTNDHYWGKYVYAAAALVTACCALYVNTDILGQSYILQYFGVVVADQVFEVGKTLLWVAVVIGVAVSWLRPLRVGYA